MLGHDIREVQLSIHLDDLKDTCSNQILHIQTTQNQVFVFFDTPILVAMDFALELSV